MRRTLYSNTSIQTLPDVAGVLFSSVLSGSGVHFHLHMIHYNDSTSISVNTKDYVKKDRMKIFQQSETQKVYCTNPFVEVDRISEVDSNYKMEL